MSAVLPSGTFANLSSRIGISRAGGSKQSQRQRLDLPGFYLAIPQMSHFIIPETARDQLRYWTKPNRTPKPANYVYIIQAKGDPAIKVGTAKNVPSRISTLQIGNSRELSLRVLLVGDEDLERRLHKQLKGERVRGEWFSGPGVEAFVEATTELARAMIAAYQTTRQVPDFRDFPPFSEEAEPSSTMRGAFTPRHESEWQSSEQPSPSVSLPATSRSGDAAPTATLCSGQRTTVPDVPRAG